MMGLLTALKDHIKVTFYTSEALALAHITTLELPVLDSGIRILSKISYWLYDAMQYVTEKLPSPLILSFPFTELALELVDQYGVVPDFTFDPIDVDLPITPLRIGNIWIVVEFRVPPLNTKIPGSDQLYYYHEGVYGRGDSFSPSQWLYVEDLAADALFITFIIFVIRFLRDVGMDSVAVKFSAKAFTGLNDMGLNNSIQKIRSMMERDESRRLKTVTSISQISSSLLSIMSDLTSLQSQLASVESTVRSDINSHDTRLANHVSDFAVKFQEVIDEMTECQDLLRGNNIRHQFL